MKLKRKLGNNPNLLLTPLIDMIFLVVIFFMINTGLSINPAIKVKLPEAVSGKASLEKEIIVTMTESGGIYIDEQQVTLADFTAVLQERILEKRKLEERTGEKANKVVFFQGDENLPYKKLVEVMDLARIAGIQSLSLLTTRKSSD